MPRASKHKEFQSSLPSGWTWFEKTRQNGKTRGQKDTYYMEPECNHIFPSIKKADYFLQTGELLPGRKNDEEDPFYGYRMAFELQHDDLPCSTDHPMENSADAAEGSYDFALAQDPQMDDNMVALNLHDDMQALATTVDHPAAAVVTEDHLQNVEAAIIDQNADQQDLHDDMQALGTTVDQPAAAVVAEDHHQNVVEAAIIDQNADQQVVENAADDIWNSLELDTIVDLEAEKINSRDNYWLSSTLLTNRDGGAHESIGLCGHDIDDLPHNDM
ncbi:hypothetical protein ACP4OV_029023 [Aristida adscensionis]